MCMRARRATQTEEPPGNNQEPVMIRRVAITALGALLGLSMTVGARAERIHGTPMATAMGHPRVNEVNQRLAIQQHRIDEGVARGTIRPGEAMRDIRREERIERRLSLDEAMHGGRATFFERRRLNGELDRNSVHIYDQRHRDGLP